MISRHLDVQVGGHLLHVVPPVQHVDAAALVHQVGHARLGVRRMEVEAAPADASHQRVLVRCVAAFLGCGLRPDCRCRIDDECLSQRAHVGVCRVRLVRLEHGELRVVLR